MVDETDNHDLNKYNKGDSDWDHSSDMDTIEEKLTVRDTDANKSNYTPHDGALYIATDTGTVYDGDGTSWVKASRGFDSVNTDENRINDPDVAIADSPFWIRAALGGGGTNGLGLELQGYDDGSAGSFTDKCPIRWWTKGLSTNQLLAQVVAHQTDNQFSIYTREDPVGAANTKESNTKRLDIQGGDTEIEVRWQNISDLIVGKFDDTATTLSVRSGQNDARANIRTGGPGAAVLALYRDANNFNWGIAAVENNNRLEIKPNGNAPEFRIDPDVGSIDLRGNILYGNGYESRLKISSFANLKPQDVTAISSPQRGDVAYHNGSGNAGEGIGYYDGTNWNVLDGGTQP